MHAGTLMLQQHPHVHISHRRSRRREVHAGATMVPQVTVLERKAADCIVLGNSTTSAAIAYSLSKRQKKVIHIPDLGLEAHPPTHEALRPLTLPDLNLHICRLADESASYLRGLELQTSTPMVHRCRSLELGLPLSAAGAEASRSSIGSSSTVMQGTAAFHSAMALERMADVCKEARVKLGSLAESEMITTFPMLRPKGLNGLLQPDGGVINARTVHKALQALSTRAGAQTKDHLILRGNWRCLTPRPNCAQ
ncbi:hypothetical protein DUNSADRAFT_13017 [Dunaliella salina]|uniref:Uncharacterized protein n=1 Tax=Dunaliella salina TaxID=3046 RepID=A0ABQ7GA80_DUNSA|nr:hypothetical protein DUNSADRAFT_13017 [Dunaliella salina]|eukprot:KAF5831513.1 hypothetical protein DUNSADRAFT_13017 [Dunaliella salina]